MSKARWLLLGCMLGSSLLLARPASAFEITLPLSLDTMDWGHPGLGTTTSGAGLTVLWLGGHRGKFAGDLGLGYTYLRDGSNQGYQYLTADVRGTFGIPIGPVRPYVGAMGSYWYALNQPGGLHGNPAGLGPVAGVELNLGNNLLLDFSASYYPLHGLTGNDGQPMPADLSRLRGSFSLAF